MASTTLILGAGTNRGLQDENGMRPPLTRDLFIQALANPKLGAEKMLDQMKVVFDYIARYWHLSIEQLREKEFDLEECYSLLHLQRERLPTCLHRPRRWLRHHRAPRARSQRSLRAAVAPT